MSQKENKLIKNTLIYSIGVIGTKILSFALLFWLPKLLTIAEFGSYDMFLVNIGLLLPFVTLEIPQGAYRWLSEKNEESNYFNRIISSGFLVILTLSLSVSCLILFSSKFITVEFVGLFLLTLIVYAAMNFFHSVSRGMGRNDIYVTSSIITGISLIIFVFIFVQFLEMKLDGLFIAYLISYTIPTLYLIIATKSLPSIKLKNFDKKLIKNIILFSLPLIPTTISWWLINSSSRYIIKFFLSQGDVGIFATAARFATIIVLVNTIFGSAWQDHVVQDKSDTEFSDKMFDRYFSFQIGVLFPLIACSKFIAFFFLEGDFVDSWKYMGLLFIASSFAGFVYYFSAFYQEKKKTKTIFYATLAGGILNVIFSIVFIKFIGLYAVALGMAVGYLVTVLSMAYYIKDYFKPTINKFKIFGLMLLLTGYILSTLYIDNLIIEIILILVSFILFFFLNRETIKILIQVVMLKLKRQ